MLPDIDHPDSTISREFGFLTEAFAWLVDRLSGGHRHGTHSLVGIAVFSVGALAAGTYQLSAHVSRREVFSWHMVPAAIYLALLCSAALRALHVGGHHGDRLGIGGSIITCYTCWDLVLVSIGHWHVPVLALAVALGCAAHIAGDKLIHGGCPLFWPVSGHEFHLVPPPCRSPPPSSQRTGWSSRCSCERYSWPPGTPPATRCYACTPQSERSRP